MTPLSWMLDPALCGQTFGGPTWEAGRALVAAIFGLAMTPEQMTIFSECTQRTVAPVAAFTRAMIAAGRGAGKTLLCAFVVVFIAASRDFHAILGPGELAYVRLFCPDRRQSRVAFRYVRGLLRASPMLAQMIVSETADSITLTTGCVIEIGTASFKSARGYGLAAVVVDECAYLQTDEAGANPDVELVRAVTPGLARVPGSLLLCISSPYAKRGVLWSAFQKHHGVDGAPVLTWQAPTRRMNPTIGQAVVDEAIQDDAAAARSEWMAEFRSDLESFVDAETLERCVAPGRRERQPMGGVAYVVAFDAALGGTASGDSFTGCVLHSEGDRRIVDKLVEIRPKFDPNVAIDQLVGELVKPYRVAVVYSDRFAKDFVTTRLKAHGIRHKLTDFDRSAAYLAALPWITGGRLELPDPRLSPVAARMMAQFVGLQRKTGGSGKDSIDHTRSGHDDLANVVALALAQSGLPRHQGGIVYLEASSPAPPPRPVPSRPLLPAMPAYQSKPWTYGSAIPCPLPPHLRRTRG